MSKVNLGNELPCMCCYTCKPECQLNIVEKNLKNQQLERDERHAYLSEIKPHFQALERGS